MSLFHILSSPDFLPQVAREVRHLLGLRQHAWGSLSQMFTAITRRPVDTPQRRFNELGADPEAHAAAAEGVRQILGHLPAGWEDMPIAELEKLDERGTL